MKMLKPSICAIVPMRHNSERVPGKNYKLFAGKPLYHHIIENLLESKFLSEIVIDTDSPFIIEEVSKIFPKITLIERPKHLQCGLTAMNDVLLHTTNQVKADFYFQTHSTNPLLTVTTIDKAIKLFINNYPMYDSLFSVNRWQTRLWDELGRAINHNPSILLRTQDLPPVYEENSCFYLFSKEILEKNHNRIGNRPLMYDVPKNESWDIDEEIDFKIAEFLYYQNQKNA